MLPAVHRVHRHVIDVGYPPASPEMNHKWREFQFNFYGVSNRHWRVDEFTDSPLFECNGHQWRLRVYPAGVSQGRNNATYICLQLCSPGTAHITFEVNVLNKFGGKMFKSHTQTRTMDRSCYELRVPLLPGSSIWDRLDDNGTLSVIISIKEDESDAKSTVFVPKNPLVTMIQEKFLDEETADVCFEVSSSDIEEDRARKRQRTFTPFHAHSCILKICAPMLASLFEGRSVKVAQINDISPDIFHHILYYVYGGQVSEEDLKAHAKDIIDASDRYSIVNLKLEAEAVYVKATTITIDNAIDHLLYADAKNLALLKEAVMDFLAENSEEATEKISFTDDVPGHIMKDLLVAVSRNKKKGGNQDDNNFTVMRVSELRKKLDEKGLSVDGSRETMIETLKRSAAESEA